MTDTLPVSPPVSAPFARILVAVDGSYTTTRGLKIGAQLAAIAKGELAVVHVVDTLHGFTPQFAFGPRPHESTYIDNGRSLLDVMVETLPEHEHVQRFLRTGDPCIEIARAANEWGADLLIVGGPSHHRLGRLLLGSVDEAVLDRAKCAILVVAQEPTAKS